MNSVTINFRFLGLLLSAADDPEVGLGSFAQGVRVGPGVENATPPSTVPTEEKVEAGISRRRNYPTTDQTRRGQLIRLSEEEAKIRFPRLVIASLGANRKDRPNGEVAARVLHDGTDGLSVNTKTRLWDQERSPISSDIKRAMRSQRMSRRRTARSR